MWRSVPTESRQRGSRAIPWIHRDLETRTDLPILPKILDVSTGTKIRVGPAGWSYKDWEGIFYPPGMSRQKKHPLELVARCFDLVEINIARDLDLYERYKHDIPVVLIDDVEAFRHRLTAREFLHALRQNI